MSLSPYFKPSVLNGGLFGANRGLEGVNAFWGQGKDFDKRDAKAVPFTNTALAELISEAKTIAEMLTNTVGTRSPYYTIGEIQGSSYDKRPVARYFQDIIGNIVRAVTTIEDAAAGLGQKGVIIDGFGTVNGKIDVELTKNPVVFIGSSVTDTRYRNPNTVNMTVYVSNRYSDNGLGATVDYLLGMDPTRLGTEAYNALSHGGDTRAQHALYALKTLQEKGKPFTVYTPHGVYENMVIKSLTPRTTAENVDMLECDVVFQEIIMFEPYVTTENYKYPARTTVLEGEVYDKKSEKMVAFDNTDYTKAEKKFMKTILDWLGKTIKIKDESK